MMAAASGDCSAQITGTLRLMMAAFSPAIVVSVSPEKFGVIHADRRDHGRQRRLDHVGGIQPPAEADFQQHHVGRMLREQTKRRRGLNLEKGDGRAGIGPLAMLQRRAQFFIADQRAAAGPPQTKAFVDPHQRGRGIGVNAQLRGFQNRPQIRDRRTLAIGAGDVNHRRQLAFGMFEPLQQKLHPLQTQIDAIGMQRRQPRDQFAERLIAFGRWCVHAWGAAGATSAA